MSAEPNSDLVLYCNYMEEVKQRITLIERLLKQGSLLGDEIHDYEVFSLNLRKILELIAFSSLTANKAAYSAQYEKFHKHRCGSSFMAGLEKSNPNFYPLPVSVVTLPSTNIKTLEPLTSGFLTKKEWVKLYDLCSLVLHVWNPYSSRHKEINFVHSVSEWLRKIRNLLDVHYIQPVDQGRVYLVVMNDEHDGKVHVYTAEEIKNEA